MARNLRQSKILDIISTNEVETQEDLLSSLKRAGFDVTQATISRDIKELGLIKILTDNKKYKYAIVNNSTQALSSKFLAIFKECVISLKVASNLVVIKTLNGTASLVSSLIDQMQLNQVLGCTYGNDTVMVAALDVDDSYYIKNKLSELIA